MPFVYPKAADIAIANPSKASVPVEVGNVIVPVLEMDEITGDVKVLFVKVSVVALPTNVSVAAGKVRVTSAVAAGPIKVTAFVPLSVSSLNKILPAAAELPVITGAVKSLFVSV